ncbi:hypothetical protein BDZ89DRAFT_1067477 [Hymenopellis radicata]|nr:hypothetical protein BDZ89DRAFT_1067477 [Hymenopellis radicata]
MPAAPCPEYELCGYYPTFPFHLNLRTDAPRRLYDDLIQKRRAAQKSPITSMWSFTEVIQKTEVQPGLNTRPIPSFALEGGTFRFQARWAEQGVDKDDHFSQVWVANVSKVDDAETAAQPERVILKIFQPSMLPLPSPTIAYRYMPGPAHQLAFSEDVLYTRLKRLQGSRIPYFFGTFKIPVPSGEEAYVLMMEYIDGETLESWVMDYEGKKLSALPIVINSIIDAFREIHEERVLHTDMARHLSNILIDKNGMAVVIDFVENAILNSAEQAKDAARSRSGDENQGCFCVRKALKRCLEYADYETKIKLEKWLNEPGNLPSELEWPNGPAKPDRDLCIGNSDDEEDDDSDGEDDYDAEWRVQ